MGIFSHKTKFKETDFLNGYTDYHSHILPGVDDGAKTIDDSLEILAAYEQLGVDHIWLTPHIMEDYPNEPKQLREKFEYLQSEYKSQGGKIMLSLAAENMLDELFDERLESNDLLPLGEAGNHLLVETSYFNPPMNMLEKLKRIMSAGYFPILAHPERYVYMDKEFYAKLKDMGVKFQLNISSVAGMFGNAALDKAEWLLDKGMIDITGGDIHSIRFLRHMTNDAVKKSILKKVMAIKNKTL